MFIKHGPNMKRITAELTSAYNAEYNRKNPAPNGGGMGVYRLVQPGIPRPFVPKHCK